MGSHNRDLFITFLHVLVRFLAIAIATASILSEYTPGLLFAIFMVLTEMAFKEEGTTTVVLIDEREDDADRV